MWGFNCDADAGTSLFEICEKAKKGKNVRAGGEKKEPVKTK